MLCRPAHLSPKRLILHTGSFKEKYPLLGFLPHGVYGGNEGFERRWNERGKGLIEQRFLAGKESLCTLVKRANVRRTFRDFKGLLLETEDPKLLEPLTHVLCVVAKGLGAFVSCNFPCAGEELLFRYR